MQHSLYVLLFVVFSLFHVHVQAGKITVSTTSDGGAGSLRQAVVSAASGDTIVFAAALNNQHITLTSGQIVINKNLVVLGPGAGLLTILSSGNLSPIISRRIFYISLSRTVVIRGLTLAGGIDGTPATSGKGGAIYNAGHLLVERCTFDNNRTLGNPNKGGAIFSSGNLRLNNVTFLNNSAQGAAADHSYGGAVYNEGSGNIVSTIFSSNTALGIPHGGALYNDDTLTISKSTFNANSAWGGTAAYGGAIYNSSDLEIINSTISGNTAYASGTAYGGGIYNDVIVRLVYSTVTLNYAIAATPLGGGFYNSGIFALHSALVAGNVLSAGTGTEDGYNVGYVSDFDYNLIGIADPSLGLSEPHNITGTVGSPVDPKLGPLQYNGGLTNTHALLAGSPAIDAGNPNSLYPLIQDQRGTARPYNALPDIGSFEFTSPLPVVVITSPSNNASFTAPANILIRASVTGAGNGKFLQVENLMGGFKKIKLGYDNIGVYHGAHNVLASGNNKLEITLKDFNGTADWTKIQIRPNGSTASPLSLAPYVTQAGGVGNQFTTITIPLSHFHPSIDFTHLTMFELPYSNNAAPFKIGIEKIIFTGGTSPFIWFGNGKSDNAHDGSGTGGELLASLQPQSGYGGVVKVEFYMGNTKIGEDLTAPFSFNWTHVPAGNYQLKALARYGNGTISSSPVINVKVVPAAALVFSDQKQGQPDDDHGILVYPNPVQDKVAISNVEEETWITIHNEMGNVVYRNIYTGISGGEADLSGLPSGIYLLRLEGADHQLRKVVKLVKE